MNYKDMVMPCCKTPLPAPIDMVAQITCKCGEVYTPERIEEFNALLAEPKQ